MTNGKKHKSLLPILLVIFFALFGYTVPLPVVTPMLLDGTHGILPGTSETLRNIILGLALAGYPIGQFFGTPIIGQYSDKYGRKKVLLISLGATVLAYILTAISIAIVNIPLLIISRFITGFSEGNVTIAQAAAADLSTPKTKNKYFAFTTSAMSLGWIVGPIVGAKLANPQVVSWFNFQTPFWFVALLMLITTVIAYFQFEDAHETHPEEHLHPLDAVTSIVRTLKKPKKRRVYLSIMFLFFGVFFFFQFWPAYMFSKHNISPETLAEYISYGAIACIIGQQLFLLIEKHPHIRMALFCSTLLLGSAQLLLVQNERIGTMFFTVPLWGISLGIAWTASTLFISNITSDKNQGKGLGIFQSTIALSTGIPPLISGFIAASNPAYPLIIGSILVFIASITFLTTKSENS